MGWLAMASGSNQLEDALATARSDLKLESSEQPGKADSGPAKAPRAARPVRDAGGVVVVNRSTVKAPEPSEEEPPEEAAPARAPVRSTQARLPKIQLRAAKTVTPQQVLAALSGRGMEDWQLAQDLGVAPDALDKILTTLEDEGAIRLMPTADGQRMVVRID